MLLEEQLDNGSPVGQGVLELGLLGVALYGLGPASHFNIWRCMLPDKPAMHLHSFMH